MKINVIAGDILESKSQYIAQQYNTVTNNYKGLSEAVVKKFPWADFYSEHRKLGTIKIAGNEKQDQRMVIAMFAQRYPGKSKFSSDSKEVRAHAFWNCLMQIQMIHDLKEISFPYNIGCGLAGGDWKEYLAMLERFAEICPNVQVNIYKLN